MTSPTTPSRAERLAASRATLSKQRDDLAALPADAGIDRELQQIDGLLRQIDALIEPKPVKVARPTARKPGPSFEQIAEIARLRKDACTEIRISVRAWQGRRAVDLRQWYLPRDSTEWRPTSKGMFLNAPLAQALIEALQQAQQHLQQP